MEPSSMLLTVGKQVASHGAKRLLSFTTQAKYEAAIQKMVMETTFELEAAVIKLAQRIERESAVMADRLSQTLTEEEFAALFARLYPEAVFSATKERRRLMAAAIAGLFTPDLAVEEKSRIVRAVASLEPSDLIHLRVFVNDRRVSDMELALWQKLGRGQPHSSTALELAGCLIWRDGVGQSGYIATALGKAVVKSLQDWSPVDSEPTPTTVSGGSSVNNS